MKKLLTVLGVACALLFPAGLRAAPITINNPSFEAQTPELTSGQWTNNLEPSWKETGGPSSTLGFMEWLNLLGEDGVDTLGMELGHDVWQDTGAVFEANKVYTLTVKVGNRSGSTVAGNQSTYGLANTSGVYQASRFVDASTTVGVGNFADAPSLTLDTFADPCVSGTIRVLLQARGAARSHFDLIRLDVVDAVAGGRPAGTLSAATSVTSTGATLNGAVSAPGSGSPSVIFYYDTVDRGGNVAAWTTSVSVPGTQAGAFSASLTGLLPATTYYYRARLTNGSGAVWAAPCLSFTTAAAPPVVENVAPSSVAGSTAVVGANVTSTGGNVPNVTLYYGPADGGTTAGAWASSISIPSLSGIGTRSLTGLSPATTYYYRAFAQNSGGSDWADASATFTTITVTPPVFSLQSADNVTGTSAVLRGQVSNGGGDPPVITLYWGLTDGGTSPGAWGFSRVLGPDSGDFSSMIQGLTPQTTYYFSARAVNAAATVWAASRSFTTGTLLPTSVIINEIHFDPADPTKREEFIELHNPTASAIDMSGWVIDDGVQFTFPSGAGSIIAAGGYKVVAENTAAFTAAFPTSGAPVGQWAAGERLSNKGERIRLRNALGTVIDEVDYKAGFPWPTAAKGTGVSAELIHPSLNNDLGGNWRSGLIPTVATYVPFASQWRWRRGVVGDTGEPAAQFTSWRLLNFTEPAAPAANAQWATNTAPFGYGENDGITGETENTTPLPDMIAGGAAPDYTSIYMRKVFTIPAGQLPAFLQIKVRVDDGAIVWINGVYVGAIRPNAGINTGHHFYNSLGTNAPEPPPVDVLPIVSAASVNLVEGNNVIAIHALNTSTTSSDFFIDAELKQSLDRGAGVSPGFPNTSLPVNASVPPPAIRGVEHTPAMPTAGQDVVVTATITDPDSVGTVSLAYQIVNPGSYIRLQDAAYNLPSNWTTVTMNDAGTGGDAVAGDAVFSASIPGSVQQHRRLIRYRITAADTLANSVTVPYPDDEQPNFAYFCYNGVPGWTGAFRPTAFAGFAATPPVTFPPSLIASIQPLHLIALDADVASCMYTGPADSTPYRATLVYEGKVYDHITFNVRGIGSTRVSGKNKIALKFLRTRDFRARDNWGRQFQEDWNSFGLDANASPWAAMHRGSAGVEDASSYRIFELGGMNSLRTTYSQLRIIRKAAESAPAGTTVADNTIGGSVDGQYTSDLWGLYLMLEPTESNFLDERGLPDGNIYAIEGNAGDKKYQATNQVSNGSDWTTYGPARIAGGQTKAWYETNMDLPNLYTYIALSRLVGNVDVRDGDNYRYYHRSSDNRWVILGYDHDMQFIAGSHWVSQTPVDGVVSAGVPHSYAAIMRHPELALEYRNRCRELISLIASDAASNGGQVGQLLDEYSQMVNPAGEPVTWADLDANMWNIHPRSTGAGANNGQTNHRGNFYRALFTDSRGAGTGSIASTYLRNLPDPDNDGFSDHEGIIQWFKDYATNTYPAVGAGVTAWTRRPTSAGTGAAGGGADTYAHRQKGFGWKYLEWESLYGGYFNFSTNPTAGTAIGDLTAAGTTAYAVNGSPLATLSSSNGVLYPDKPVITFSGTAGYPVNDVRLHSSNYRDPNSDAITAVQWRIGEISAPGIPLYDPTAPRIYEITDVWRSAEIATANPTGIVDVRVPASAMRVGHTYRARVRHKDSTGRWSFWSEPLQFVAGAADLTAFRSALRVTEINYNPGPLTAGEITAGATDEQNFEFIELRNISAQPIQLTDVHFRDAVDYDFPDGFTLAGGASTIVCKNPAAFAIRYPAAVAQLAPGSYGTQSLSNGGENIELKYGLGDDATSGIFKFSYDDSGAWPAGADGQGSTLVLKTPAKPSLAQQYGRNPTTQALNAGSHEDPAEWRISYLPNGNPGSNDGYNYGLWAAGNPDRTDPDADPNKNGYDNRLEYALTGLTQASATIQPPVANFTEVSGLDYAGLTFTRRNDTEDLSFSVQFSDELMTWTLPGVLVSSQDNGDGTSTQFWRSADPVSTQTRLFGRVLVTTIP